MRLQISNSKWIENVEIAVLKAAELMRDSFRDCMTASNAPHHSKVSMAYCTLHRYTTQYAIAFIGT